MPIFKKYILQLFRNPYEQKYEPKPYEPKYEPKPYNEYEKPSYE